jgi:O-antigen ligase
MNYLKSIIIGLLIATVFTPLVISMEGASAYVLPKAIFFRSLIEVTLIFSLIYASWHLVSKPAESFRTLSEQLRVTASNPLVITLSLFFISLLVSTLLAVDRYWAFWGPIDRAEGLWGMLHILCFFILVSIFFARRHWLLFFKVSLGVGIAISLRAFLEYFGLFGFTESNRPISFAGNPSYVAVQMIFLLGFSALFYYESNKATELRWSRLAWRVGTPFIGLLFLSTLLITKTRGALLGFILGIIVILAYFAFRKKPATGAESNKEHHDKKTLNQAILSRLSFQNISRPLLILVIILGTAFLITRDASIWQSVPGLDRLAQTSTLDNADDSSQVRLKVWKISLAAFKERPYFGWGPENFIVAFERHYDPDIANYGEFWFDRAHNKLLDVLVMQGGFGLLTYLALIGTLIYQITRIKQVQKAILLGLITAHLTQNLFLFDDLISYLYFSALLGYVCHIIKEKSEPKHDTSIANTQKTHEISYRIGGYTLAVSSLLLSTFITASLYYLNFVPVIQANHYQSATSSSSVDVITEMISKAMQPYNFAQAGIRSHAIDEVYLHQFFHNDAYRTEPKHAPLGNLLILGIHDIIDRHPDYDARVYSRLVEIINGYARTDPSYYAKAEPLIRKALKIAPAHQEIHYHLAFNLAGQKRIDEAIKAAQYAVNLSPSVVVAHLRLAFMYALANDSENSQKEIVRMKELDPSLKRLSEHDWRTLRFLYPESVTTIPAPLN